MCSNDDPAPARRDLLEHEALLHGSDDAFLQRVVPFVADGIANGEPTLVCLRPRERALLDAELDPERLPEAIALFDFPTETLRTLRDAADGDPGRPVNVVGSVPTEPWGRWVRFEATLNHVLADRHLRLICAYDATSCPAAVLGDALRTHPLRTVDVPVADLGYIAPRRLLADLGDTEAAAFERTEPDVTFTTLDAFDDYLDDHFDDDRHARDAIQVSVHQLLPPGARGARLRAWHRAGRLTVEIEGCHVRVTSVFDGIAPDRGDPLLQLVNESCSHTTFTGDPQTTALVTVFG